MDYFCNQGYSLQGSSRVFCDQNGQWGSTPTCQQGDTFGADNLSAHKFKIIIINTLCLFLWQKWTFSFLQCAHVVVHQVFQMVTLVQDRVHTTVVLLWTILVTKDSLYKAAVEWLATRIDSGDLLLPVKEVNLKFTIHSGLPNTVIHLFSLFWAGRKTGQLITHRQHKENITLRLNIPVVIPLFCIVSVCL